MFELHRWGHLAELLGFDHKLAVHAELLGCVLQRLLVLSFTCPLARALGLCITETHSRTSCQPYGEHAVGCRKAPLCTHLGPIWASATGAAETFSFSDLRSTASGALEKRWRSCSSRKTTSKDVRCTPTRCAASFFSLAACPGALLRPSNSACRQRAGRCAAENHRNCPLPDTSRSKRTAASRFEADMYGYFSLRGARA